mmetsp:Transcript_18271/g.55802  ORF Transcript_18271/g.55802 Transcript_18271/m.55802 type:complete len:95 (-) Transcript_18271:2318-2602(-)
MSGMGGGGGRRSVKKVMTQPINLIFKFLQQGTPIRIWLYENTSLFMEGTIAGFDEYMNVVLDNAAEVQARGGERKELGRILLKGDCITLIQPAS